MTVDVPHAAAGRRHRLRLLPDIPEIGWTPYAWLIYLGIFFSKPLLQGATNRVEAARIARQKGWL